MGLFDYFRKNYQENKVEEDNISTEVPKSLFVDETDPVQEVTGVNWIEAQGIVDVYAFLQADYESRGYSDALTNPDEGYRTDNLRLLRQDLGIHIQRADIFLTSRIKELDFHINSRSRAGLIDLVEELRMRREIISGQISRLMAIKSDAENGNGLTERIELSYNRGFMRGLTAITQSKVLNNKL